MNSELVPETAQQPAPTVEQLVDTGYSGLRLRSVRTGEEVSLVAVQRYGAYFVKTYAVEFPRLLSGEFMNAEELAAHLLGFERI